LNLELWDSVAKENVRTPQNHYQLLYTQVISISDLLRIL